MKRANFAFLKINSMDVRPNSETVGRKRKNSCCFFIQNGLHLGVMKIMDKAFQTKTGDGL